MKRFLAPILLLVLLFPTLALGEEVTYDDLVERNGLYYQKFTDVPFTGKTTGQRQGSFRDGKKHGSWVDYYDNGQLFEKGTFKNGDFDGSWVWYWSNGQLFKKGTYKNGKREGYWESYDKNGQSDEYAGTFKDGKKISD